jgi:O-antigen/teichoic acid export membrane protein
MSQEESTSSSASTSESGFSTSRIIKNAFANIARGGSAALVTILLPPFLVRILTKDEYGTWLLILQLSTYVNFLDFGIQTAIGRFVAYTTELKDFQQRDAIASTALGILVAMGGVALIGLTGFAWQIPQIFSSMPPELHQQAQYTLLLIGGSLAIGLPFSTFGGIFIGIQRYDVTAWIIGLSKIIGGVLVILTALLTHNIIWMGMSMAICTLGGSLGQYFAYRSIADDIKILPKKLSRKAGVEIFNYCFSISVWNLGMLLVSGLDTIIVGFFDYKSVVYYSLAVNLTNFVIQLQSAIFSVMMPAAATLSARQDTVKLGQLLRQSTRYGTLILLITGIPLILGAKWILIPWIGSEYASNTAQILQVLVIANIVRLAGLPYATLMVALGQQRIIILSPLVEGGINFFFSILATSKIGAIGAAIGTLIGSFISILFHFTYNMPRTKGIQICRHKLIVDGLFRPIICSVPCIFMYALIEILSIRDIALTVASSVVSILVSVVLVWKWALNSKEQETLLVKLYRLTKQL